MAKDSIIWLWLYEFGIAEACCSNLERISVSSCRSWVRDLRVRTSVPIAILKQKKI